MKDKSKDIYVSFLFQKPSSPTRESVHNKLVYYNMGRRGGRERGLEGIYRGREDAGDGSMLIAISRRGDGSLLPQRPHPCSGR